MRIGKLQYPISAGTHELCNSVDLVTEEKRLSGEIRAASSAIFRQAVAGADIP